MKNLIIIILLAAFSLVLIKQGKEADLSQAYPLAPYDRCMASYQGSVLSSQCELLK
jgi:hypothetical protein